jgi:serine/threonine-protein kinase HipA
MKFERRTISVWADWLGLGEPRLMGALSAAISRGKEVFSFAYDDDWLGSEDAQTLDPELQLYAGPQYPPVERRNFNIFLDSSPDRWGRVLLERREAQMARKEQRPERTLMELDYLLGVYDGHRMGALRFREGDGSFLDDNAEYASPPWATLRELEQASLALERDGAERNPEYGKWLRMLIAPGRSLGGQRPKASVRDEHGDLWIAKFPKSDDRYDIGAWEMVAHTLAKRAGIVTPEADCKRFSGRHHTFLSRRFDRRPGGQRLHFSSALTMLSRTDGDSDASYLEMVEFLIRNGADTGRDLEQLWRRIAFHVLISNTDDHLRNHGFMLDPPGWSLAPAYDMNPYPFGDGLALNISETDNAQDLAVVLGVADVFRLKSARANEILREVRAAAREWRGVANSLGLSGDEQERVANAFRVADGE